MKKKMIAVFVVGCVVGSAWLYGFVQNAVNDASRKWNSFQDWSSQEAIEKDPEGFVAWLEERLEEDLETMRSTRHELAGEVGQLTETIREQETLLNRSQLFADECRAAYQTASYPVQIGNAAYTEQELYAQVSQLLAEIEGYDTATGKLQAVREDAESQLQNLVVKINETETELASLSVKRVLLKTKLMTEEGEAYLAQVDALLNDNQRAIEGSPVRSTTELIADSVSGVNDDNTSWESQVVSFLSSGMEEENDFPEVASEENQAETRNEVVLETEQELSSVTIIVEPDVVEVIEDDETTTVPASPVSIQEQTDSSSEKDKPQRQDKDEEQSSKPIYQQS